MFKKLSIHMHKSQSQESTKNEELINRDSLIDPASNPDYSQDHYQGQSHIEGKQVEQLIDTSYTADSQHSYSQQQYYNYHDQDNLSPPPLTIDSQGSAGRSMAFPSPASVPSPITPSAENQGKAEVTDTEIENLIQEGISYHEKGQLEKATHVFRIVAERDNPIGMFLYGVSLRHGWGCKKNEHMAFQYLQKAAEHAVEDLANITSKVNTSAAKNELVMAIYELGVSFRHGWGCKKNKESAVQFFQIAADLGDPDAQNDLAHCYYHGQGVKKDIYLAAKYYRKADKQGQGIMGNSWIWKEKYDSPAKKKK